jgi:regulator of protease activity HflC (stomatin/prohibitin superfamily)
MKQITFLFSLILFLTSCSTVGVSGDEEAVLVAKPYFFGSGGVYDEPVNSGRQIIALSTDDIIFKITPIAYSEGFKNLISDDNVPLDFETHLTLRAKRGLTPDLYKGFGEYWYKNNVSPKFRALVRDKISSYTMQDLISNREVLTKIDAELKESIEKYFKEINIPVDVIMITIGAATPPGEVLAETQKTAAQNQSILTQAARAKAENSRKNAEVNKAIADNAYKAQMNMTTSEYLKLREIEIEKEKIEVVRDKQNVTIVMGTGLTPVVPIK